MLAIMIITAVFFCFSIVGFIVAIATDEETGGLVSVGFMLMSILAFMIETIVAVN